MNVIPIAFAGVRYYFFHVSVNLKTPYPPSIPKSPPDKRLYFLHFVPNGQQYPNAVRRISLNPCTFYKFSSAVSDFLELWHGSATLHGTLQPCPPFLLAWHRLVSCSVSCARLGRSDAARLHWAFPDGLLWQNVVKGNPSTFAVLQSAHSPAALSCPKKWETQYSPPPP